MRGLREAKLAAAKAERLLRVFSDSLSATPSGATPVHGPSPAGTARNRAASSVARKAAATYAAPALEPRPPAHALLSSTAALGAEAPLERVFAPAALPDNPSAKPVRASIAALMEDLRDDAVRFYEKLGFSNSHFGMKLTLGD